MRCFIETENNLTAVERLDHYARNIPIESTPGGGDPPAATWPEQGGITLSDLRMRYRPGLPLVLKGLTLSVRPREKLGIVGRTGSGKSSLVQARRLKAPLVESAL